MKIKITILMVVIIIFTIFVSQNTEIIPINALFWQYRISTIVLICLVFLLGLIAGFIIARMFNAPSKKEKEKERKKQDFESVN